jgi:hypothetical protein
MIRALRNCSANAKAERLTTFASVSDFRQWLSHNLLAFGIFTNKQRIRFSGSALMHHPFLRHRPALTDRRVLCNKYVIAPVKRLPARFKPDRRSES